MPDFRVTPYRQELLDQIRPLWREYFGPEVLGSRESLFRWITERNPHRGDAPPYYLLMDGERVIGMHGHMPLRFSLGGERRMGFLAHDDLLSSDYRGQGLGKVMLSGVAEQSPPFAGALWHNEPNRRLYGKCGWVEVPDFFPWVKILDPMSAVRGRLGEGLLARTAAALLGAGLRARDLASPRASSSLRVEEISAFDSRFDELFDAAAPSLEASVVRDAAYLNWKFVEKPGNRYLRLAAADAGDSLAGYAVLRTDRTEDELRGKIVDLLADPRRPEAFAALIGRSLEELRGRGAARVEVACTHEPFCAQLRRFGFLRANTPLRFMLSQWEGIIEPAWVESARHWYLCFADADGDAWTVDS
jgi:GNAT superfamily N-acetyltransferase